ncbi:MBL fold metallo-hydrolase [Streptomyces pharetrae]|jgi:ribonuclease BN (tRNA processing enzyme)|uniref:MBL fold metallo-hydrolase n=1 Tax=Streptomyces pharetrae TaxID=291370 RepID=UPI0034604BE3
MPESVASPTRRTVLRTAAAAGGLSAAALSLRPTPAAAGGSRTELVLLGTSGGPVPMSGRAGISSALVVDGRVYLVDCGPGTFGRYAEAALAAEQLEAVFLTHLHSDHLADLYPLLWLRFGGFQALGGPVQVYGPGSAGELPKVWPAGRAVDTVSPASPAPGTAELLRRHIEGTAYDINVRMRSEGWPDIRELIVPHDIRFRMPRGAGPDRLMAPPMKPFEVMRDERVRVTAVLVEHPPVFPSFAFRFDTADGSVVFSGDTAPCGNVERLACGADVLVHEVMDLATLKLGGLRPAQLRHMEISHTDAGRLGPLAERAGAGTLVLSHLVPGSVGLVPDSAWHAKAQQGYSGRVVVGRDLVRLPVRRARRG